jgi:hypothetical protein
MTIHDQYEHAPLPKWTRYERRRRAGGRCIVCGKFTVTARHCARHAEAQNARRRERYAQR